MNMFYKKHDNLKIMRFIVPLFSGLTVLGFYLEMNYSIHYAIIIPVVLGIVTSMSFGVFKVGTTGNDILACITSLIYGGLLLGCAVSVEYLDPIQKVGKELEVTTGRMFAYLYSIVACTDIFAYLFGSMFGKHKRYMDSIHL